jgi:hypothetical protein
VLEEAFEKEHSVPIEQHHLALEFIVSLEMGLNGSIYFSPDLGSMHLLLWRGGR